jgi:hypothetical protein
MAKMRARRMYRQQVNYAQRIARIADDRSKLFGNTKLALGRRQNHHAAIRRDPPPSKAAVIFLPWTAGKAKAVPIVGYGGRGRRGSGGSEWHQQPIPTLDQILTLHPPPSNPSVGNKMAGAERSDLKSFQL